MHIRDNRTSDSYIMTIDSLEDRMLAHVRKIVHKRNSTNNEKKYRICVKGRLGKNNPNASKYRNRSPMAYQNICLEDASHFDVYLYERRD